MKFFPVLLLSSLASTSPAILKEPEDEIHLEAQLTDASSQFTPRIHPRKDHLSYEDFSKEVTISREEVVFEEDVVMKSTRRPKSKKPELLHPLPQEDRFQNVDLQLEVTTEITPKPATTSEGKLTKLGHKIGKNLDKTRNLGLSKRPNAPCL